MHAGTNTLPKKTSGGIYIFIARQRSEYGARAHFTQAAIGAFKKINYTEVAAAKYFGMDSQTVSGLTQ
jgi:hypothetical protein